MKTLNSIYILILSLTLPGCNLMYENINGSPWNSLHSSKPICSSIYHGASYRFPHGACDEAQCHGANLMGGNTGSPSCYMCHVNIWDIFSNTHIRIVAGKYHHIDVDNGSGFTDDRNTDALWYATCKNASCHGLLLQGTIGPCNSCTSCHNPIPPPGHRNKKEGYWHHYNASSNRETYCNGSVCHGNSGQVDNTFCAPCHEND